MIIGSHVSMKANNYFVGSIEETHANNANALMLYTGAPQNTKRIPIDLLHIPEALALMKEYEIPEKNLIIHAPYLINLANPESSSEQKDFNLSFLNSEIERACAMHASCIVLHPGSSVHGTKEEGIEVLAEQLNRLKLDNITLCLETMAGKGREIGSSFEELAKILDRVSLAEHIGICLDTCHINDAGYSLDHFDSVLDQFDRIIGIEKLKVIHLNDSKNERGSHSDRHANIGMGTIGFDNLLSVAVNARTSNVPKILETPWIDGHSPYKAEISMLKNGAFNAESFIELHEEKQQTK